MGAGSPGPGAGGRGGRGREGAARRWGRSRSPLCPQVSHHPPVSAFHVSNRKDGFCISGSVTARSRFYGNSLSALLDGKATLTFLHRAEDYTLTMPYAHCKGEGLWVPVPGAGPAAPQGGGRAVDARPGYWEPRVFSVSIACLSPEAWSWARRARRALRRAPCRRLGVQVPPRLSGPRQLWVTPLRD
ncbi:hypothetical protein QTO34_003128 [Cnephaeus nilssonii]|uniref:Uncharacterized protein n=1 Tax=Cnephaeus nilssonii TaxID=3371016 RepID=A0AA40LKB8_CNENI|nr:hypothetical protein QTO34_003128 [Eptesicus nilssonii]